MTIESDIEIIVDSLNRRAAPIMAKRLAVSFAVGWKLGGSKARLTDVQKRAIAGLSKEQIGYIAEFHASVGKTLLDNVKANLAEGGGYKSAKGEIIPIVESVFGKDGKVIIDRTGQKKTIVALDKNGNLYRKEITISRPYTTTIENYSTMLGRTSVHQAIKDGRSQSYQAKGIDKWVFTGPDDERARPWHVVLIGRVFKFGTPESDMAEEILGDVNCRHRQIPHFGDFDLDTPDSVYAKARGKVFFNDDTQAWEYK